MPKIGLLRLLALALVGFVVPYGAYRLSRRIGTPLIILLAVALGLAYGAVKAENPWSGRGLAGNLTLMAVSALALAAYAALSLGAARLIAKAANIRG